MQIFQKKDTEGGERGEMEAEKRKERARKYLSFPA